MRFKLSACAALLAASMASAYADDFTLNAGTLPVAPSPAFGHVFIHQPGSFFDTINFNIVANNFMSSANALNLSLAGIQIFQVGDLNYTVWDYNHPNGMISYGTFSGSNLTNSIALTVPGSYHIDISGTASGVAGGGYGVALITAVPEPEPYSLLLVGLGCLLFLSRRATRSPSFA